MKTLLRLLKLKKWMGQTRRDDEALWALRRERERAGVGQQRSRDMSQFFRFRRF